MTLCYLGVKVEGASYMFGDNMTVVDTASAPHGKLHKRHNALSFHRTRFAIAAGVTRFHHVKGMTNPADVMSKHWDLSSAWPMLRPMLFWRGDTADLIEEEEGEDGQELETNVDLEQAEVLKVKEKGTDDGQSMPMTE